MESIIDLKLQIYLVLFEQTDDMLILYDLHGKPVMYNPASRDLLELPPSAADLQAVPLELWDMTEENASRSIVDILDRPGQVALSCCLKTLQGTRAADLYKYAITDGDGVILYNLLRIRVHAERHLSNSGYDELLMHILENAQDAVISKDLSGRITSWNKGAEKMFGYKRNEVIGKNITVIVPGDRFREETAILQKIKRGAVVSPYDTILEKKSGKRLEVKLSVSAILDKSGQVIGASKIIRDISKEKKTQRKLQAAFENRNDLIAMASHEVKTPLAILKGYLELIYQNVSSTNKTFVDKALSQVKRLTMLINNLFHMSKLHSKKDQLSFELLDLSHLIAELIEQFKVSSPSRTINASVQENIQLEGNRIKLEQVFSNLMGNAIKYSPEDTPIDVLLKIAGDKVHFIVKDQGIGISARDQKLIFSQYYRADNAEESTPGLGLGLYISKMIVLQHRGKIQVNSEKGVGTTFTVILPLRQRKKK